MSKRSKRTTRKQQQEQRTVWLLVGIGIIGIVLVGGFLVFGGGGAPAPAATTAGAGQAVASVPQRIDAAGYQAQFNETDAPHFLLDVRTPGEFSGGHIEGAANINVDDLRNRLADVPTDQPIVVYCRSGNRSAQAARILADAGFENIYDLGGIINWERAGYPVVR